MPILNLQFSELLDNGIGDFVAHLHFSNSVILPNLDIRRSESVPKSQVDHIIFSDQFGQIKIKDL